MKESAKNLVKEILNKRDLLGRGNLLEKAEAGDETLQGAEASVPVNKAQSTLGNDVIYINMPTLMQLKPTGKVKSAGGGIKPIPTEIESLMYSFPTLQDFLNSLGALVPDAYEVGVVDSSEEVAAGFLDNLGTNNAYFDLDGDGVVTQADFSIYMNDILAPAMNFLASIQGDLAELPPFFNYGPVNDFNAQYDYNGDGVLDGSDLGMYLSNQGLYAPDPRPIMPGIGLGVGIEGGDPDMPETGGPLVPSGEEPDDPFEYEEEDVPDRPEEEEEEGGGLPGGPFPERPEEDPGLEFPMIEYAGNFIAAYGGTSFNPFTDPAFVENAYYTYMWLGIIYGQGGVDMFSSMYGVDPETMFGEGNLIDFTEIPGGEGEGGGGEGPDSVQSYIEQLEAGVITLDDIQDMIVDFVTNIAAYDPDARTDPYYVNMFDFDGNGYVDTNDFRYLKDLYGGYDDDDLGDVYDPDAPIKLPDPGDRPGEEDPDDVNEIPPDDPRGGGSGQPNPLGRQSDPSGRRRYYR